MGGFNAYNPETHEGHCGWPPADKGPVPYPGPDWKRMKFVHSRCDLLTKHGKPLSHCKQLANGRSCRNHWVAAGAKFDIADKRSTKRAFNRAARSRHCRRCKKGGAC